MIYKTIEKKKFTAIKWILIAVFSLFNIVYIISAKAWGDDSVKISQIDQEYKYIRCELDLTCEDGNINDPIIWLKDSAKKDAEWIKITDTELGEFLNTKINKDKFGNLTYGNYILIILNEIDFIESIYLNPA